MRQNTISLNHQVYCYEDGSDYRLVYELPTDESYAMEIFENRLYYGLSEAPYGESAVNLYCVNLETDEEEWGAVLPCDRLWKIKADESGVYVLVDLGTEDAGLAIYKVEAGEWKELARGSDIRKDSFSAGDGYVFYISDTENELIAIDASKGKKRVIAGKVVSVSHTDYDDGRVYVSFTKCFSYPVKNGKPCLETAGESLKTFDPADTELPSIGIPAVYDGWIYSHGRDKDYKQVIHARNRSTGERYVYPVDFSTGFYLLRDTISFGTQGFIVNDALHNGTTMQEMNRYYYYPYGGSEGIALELEAE